MFTGQNKLLAGSVYVTAVQTNLEQAMKAQSGSKGIATLSLTSALNGRGRSTPFLGRFTSGKETRYELYRTLGGHQRFAALEQYETNADMMKLNITLNTNRPKQTEKQLVSHGGCTSIATCQTKNPRIFCGMFGIIFRGVSELYLLIPQYLGGGPDEVVWNSSLETLA